MDELTSKMILSLIKHLLLMDNECSGCDGKIENKEVVVTFSFDFDIKEK